MYNSIQAAALLPAVRPRKNNTWSEKNEVLLPVFWWLALARRSFRESCAAQSEVTFFLGGSLWREASLRGMCVGGSLVSVFWWLALARRPFTGRVCCWQLSCSVTMARFGEKEVLGSRVGGSDVTAFWWLSWARRHFSGVIHVNSVLGVIYWYVAAMWVPALLLHGRRETSLGRSMFSVTPGTTR